nr:MAG TPA: hypothetical protein [Caudoviricetes sp.]
MQSTRNVKDKKTMFKKINGRRIEVIEVRGFEFTMGGQWSDMRCLSLGEVSREEGISIIKDALEAFVRELPGRGGWRIEAFDSQDVCYEARLKEEGDKTYNVSIDGEVVATEDATPLNELIVSLIGEATEE